MSKYWKIKIFHHLDTIKFNNFRMSGLFSTKKALIAAEINSNNLSENKKGLLITKVNPAN